VLLQGSIFLQNNIKLSELRKELVTDSKSREEQVQVESTSTIHTKQNVMGQGNNISVSREDCAFLDDYVKTRTRSRTSTEEFIDTVGSQPRLTSPITTQTHAERTAATSDAEAAADAKAIKRRYDKSYTFFHS
jgi:hypothetical protein